MARTRNPQDALKRALAQERTKVTEPEAVPTQDDAEQRRLEQARTTARELVKLARRQAAAARESANEPNVEPPADEIDEPSALDAPWRAPQRKERTSVAEVLSERMPSTTTLQTIRIDERALFAGIWIAHRARATADGAFHIVAAADQLIEAAHTLPPRTLHAAHVRRKNIDWAVFIDTTTGSLLAAFTPAALYLDGLK